MNEIKKNRLTDRKRELIVQAAVDQFNSNGFDRTSMDQIAKVANVSKRTVYNHFASKDELLAAILERLKNDCYEVKPVPYYPDEALAPQLIKVGTAFAKLITSKSFTQMSRIALSCFIQSPELGNEAFYDRYFINKMIQEWLQAAKDDGRLEFESSREVADQFNALITEFAYWPQMLSTSPKLKKAELERTVKISAEMILKFYEA